MKNNLNIHRKANWHRIRLTFWTIGLCALTQILPVPAHALGPDFPQAPETTQNHNCTEISRTLRNVYRTAIAPHYVPWKTVVKDKLPDSQLLARQYNQILNALGPEARMRINAPLHRESARDFINQLLNDSNENTANTYCFESNSQSLNHECTLRVNEVGSRTTLLEGQYAIQIRFRLSSEDRLLGCLSRYERTGELEHMICTSLTLEEISRNHRVSAMRIAEDHASSQVSYIRFNEYLRTNLPTRCQSQAPR